VDIFAISRVNLSAQKHVQVRGTALIRAAACGHAECTRVLIGAGADIDAQDKARVCLYIISWAECSVFAGFF
jgi:hypothetical protein